jgi:hypothetical protein
MSQTSLLMPQPFKKLPKTLQKISPNPPKNFPKTLQKKSPKPPELYGQRFKNVGFVESGGQPSVRGEGR